MVLAGYTVRRRVPLSPPRPGGAPYADPNEIGPAVVAAAAGRPASGSRCSTPATSTAASAAALNAVQRRFSDGNGDALDRPRWRPRRYADVPCRSGDPLGARRRSGVDPDRRDVGRATTTAAPRPRLRAAAGERGVPRRLRRARRSAARRGRGAERTVHRRARDARRRRRHRTLASRRSRCCICPTTERELADGIGPTAASAHAGVELCIGSRLPCRDRPVRGDARRRARRAAGLAAARQSTSRPSC